MRRLLLLAAVLALIGAGVGVAHDGQGKTVASTSATFAAATGNNVRTQTCTGSDGGAYQTTHGTWTGTVTSTDTSLNGTATIDADAVVNTTSGYGVVSGHLRIDTSSGHTNANFDSVYANGTISGLAEGHGSAPWNSLVANLSASWSPTAGFTNGTIGGGGTMPNNAVEVTSGGCPATPTPKPTTIDVHNALVTAVSSSSITAGGVTCSVPSNFASAVASLQANTSYVDMKCTSASGTNTLVSVNAKGGGQDHGKNNEGKHHH